MMLIMIPVENHSDHLITNERTMKSEMFGNESKWNENFNMKGMDKRMCGRFNSTIFPRTINAN